MSVDKRTQINDMSSLTGWTSDKSPVVDSTVFYEGSNSLADQATNSNFELILGVTSVDYSDHTLWILIKSNLVDTLANGGFRFVLGDGTNRRSYYVFGKDILPFPLSNFFYALRIDTTNLPASFLQELGSSAPNLSAITQIGYGTIHELKAGGSIDNMWLDSLTVLSNAGTPKAVQINGGTSGTPETMVDVVGDDQTNGWGVFNNPKGKEFGIFCSVEWGEDGTADSYFYQSEAQIYIDGRGSDVDNINQIMMANSTGTNSFVLDNCVIINLGAVANWDANITDHDIFKITNCQFVDGGTFSLPTIDNTDKFITNTVFDNCLQITVRTLKFEDNTIKGGTDILLNSTSHQVKNCNFISGGSGHAVTCNTIGTYNWDGNKDTGYTGTRGSNLVSSTGSADAMFFNDSGGLVTLNILNGADQPSVRNGAGATTVVSESYSFDFTILPSIIDYEWRIYSVDAIGSLEGSVELDGEESATVDNQSYVYAYSSDQPIAVQIISQPNEDYIEKVEYYTLSNANQDVNINLAIDENN